MTNHSKDAVVAKRGAAVAITIGVGTALAAAGVSQGVALADGQPSGTQGPDATAGQAASVAGAPGLRQGGLAAVQQDAVEGTFSFTQAEVSSNAWIARHVAGASAYTCSSVTTGSGAAAGAPDSASGDADGDESLDAAESWRIEVSGDVSNPYGATVGELAQSPEVQSVLMGCQCMGNPSDGLSVANALVRGIPLTALLDAANPSADANTVVISSADGYEVALPLSYLRNHYCPIVFDVNGSSLEQSVGGTNQLWLGSTPASYFVRDVSAVRVETRAEAPASPNSEEAREQIGTLPNVGVMFGGTVGASQTSTDGTTA